MLETESFVKILYGNVGEWLGKKLSLQLNHKNGIDNDHRLENLETFAGKNKLIYRQTKENKSTNFNKDPKLPKGYPGWTSYWLIGMSKENDWYHPFGNLFTNYDGGYCFSDAKDKLIPIPCIHFGTGGSGNWGGYFKAEVYLQYGITFWAEDFLNINLKKLVTLKQLRDEDISEYESTSF